MIEIIKDFCSWLKSCKKGLIELCSVGAFLYVYLAFYAAYCIEAFQQRPLWTLIIFLAVSTFLIMIIFCYILIQSMEIVDTKKLYPKKRLEAFEKIKLGNINRYEAGELQKKLNIKIGMCSYCQTYKPPRTQHCYSCGQCYFRQDHHYNILGKCIALQHYKFFYQLLLCTFLYSLIITVVFLVELTQTSRIKFTIISIFALFPLGIMVIYTGLLFLFHTFLILNNETTMEFFALNAYIRGEETQENIFMEGPMTLGRKSSDRKYLNPYNRGCYQNWTEIMGEKWYEWFLPLYSTKGNGVEFKNNDWEYQNQ